MTTGNTLALVRRDLTLIDTDSARDAREALDRLKDMARDRFEFFYEKIWYVSSLPRDLNRTDLSTPAATVIGISAISV
jgi:hypothetical protein